MKGFKKNQAGLTLIELIVAISITVLVLIGISTFFIKSINNNSAGRTKADLLLDAQLALDSMTKDIRLSSGAETINSINDPYSPDAESSNGRGWQSDVHNIILSKSVEDNNGNIIFADPNRYITAKNNIVYFVNNGSLYKRTIAEDIENNRSQSTCPETANEPDCPKDTKLVDGVITFELKYYDIMNSQVNAEQARSVQAKLKLEKNKGGRKIHAEYTTRTVFRNE